MAQSLKPISDRSLGAWLSSAGGSPTELWPSLDETSPADVDYVYTETASSFEVRLAPGSEPSVDTGHVIRLRFRGDGATPFTVTLLDNSVSPALEIATRSEISPIPGTSFQEYVFTLSASEAGSIVSYTNLSVRVELDEPEIETLIYGPDAFTGGAGGTLVAYDADWEVVAGVGLRITAGGAVGTNETAPSFEMNRWTGQTIVGQKIEGDIDVGADADSDSWLAARSDAAGDAYYALWDLTDGEIILTRETTGGGSVELARGGTVAASTVYTDAYIKVTGTNPVRIRVGDDSNGEVIDITDSHADRIQSGAPAMAALNDVAFDTTIDNVAIYEIT